MKTIKRTWRVIEDEYDGPFLDIPIFEAMQLAQKKLEEDAEKAGVKIIKIEYKNTGYLMGELVATIE